MDLITSNLGDEIKRILNDNEIIKMSVVIAFITKEGAKKFLEWVEMCHEKKSIRIILSTYLDCTSPNAIKISTIVGVLPDFSGTPTHVPVMVDRRFVP